jgi:hypothetical protein
VYDWGRPEALEGLSEYVVPGRTEVIFELIERTARH